MTRMKDRRRFLYQMAGGFLGSAMGALWADEGNMAPARLPGTPKVKSVIYLFMCGGISHIDTFDPKDNRFAGKIMDAVGFGDNLAQMKRQHRRGPIYVVPPDEPLSRGSGTCHRQAVTPVRTPVSGQLGELCAGHGK